MHTSRWSRISPLLDELLELEPDDRDARLNALRTEDAELATELQRLLALEESRPDFLSQPVLDAAVFAPQPGQPIGPYRLEHRLGEGGMGQVWLAVRADGLYERRVAVKLLRPGLAEPGLRSRFTRERQILARLGHAHIARLLDAGVSVDGQPYLTLEYVEGEPITTYAKRLNLPVTERLRLFLQVCDAVSHAHANLVVHRDLKPSNILVTPAGDVRLLDFGIAKLLDSRREDGTEITGTGTRAFTLHYAAPEQVRGEPVTTMTDVYSLGVVLYELLTGHKPYRLRRLTDAEWEDAILRAEPTRPSAAVSRPAAEDEPVPDKRLARALAGDLDNIVLKALEKAPTERYVSVEALGQDLKRHLEGRPVNARPQSLGYRMSKYLHRHGVAVATTLAVVGLLIATLAGVTWQARLAIAEAERAQAMQDFVTFLFENSGAGPQRSLDVRTLLDAGVRRAETELDALPQARAELLGLIARLRLGLGDFREALQVLDRQERAMAALGDQAPLGLRLQTAMQRGRALQAMAEPQACLTAMAPLQTEVERAAGSLPLPAADFLSQLGRCRRTLDERDGAQALFEQALALRRGASAAGDKEAESLTDLAALQADAGLVDAAIDGFAQALDRLRQATGERNGLGVDIWRSLGSLYRERGDVMEAQSALLQAQDTALAIYGAAHPITIEVQRTLGAIYVDQGRLAEAERLISDAHTQLVERLGTRHPDIGVTWNSLGVIAWERGDLAGAERDLERSIAIWRGAPVTGRLSGVLFNLALVRLEAGRPAEALPLIEECQALRLRQYGPEHALVGEALRLQGEARAALGENAAARTLIERGLELLRRSYGTDHPRTGRAELTLARLLAAQGENERAAALVGAVLQRFPPTDPERRKVAWLARAEQAALQCNAGTLAAGRAAQAAVLAEIDAERPLGSVIRREAQAAARACE